MSIKKMKFYERTHLPNHKSIVFNLPKCKKCLFENIANDLFSFKEISDLPDNYLLFLNDIITAGPNKKIKEIETIIDIFMQKIKANSLYDNEIFVFYTAILFGYYLDNNFVNKVKDFISNNDICNKKLYIAVSNLLEKYKGTNLYVMLAKNIQGFYFYNNISSTTFFKDTEKNNFLLNRALERSMYLTEELEYLYENYKSDKLYFNYLNTLLSYYAYDIIYLPNMSDSNIKDYIKKLEHIILDHARYIDLHLDKFPNSLIYVYLNHLVFYKDLLGYSLNPFIQNILNKVTFTEVESNIVNYIWEFTNLDIKETFLQQKLVYNKAFPTVKNLLSTDIVTSFSSSTILSKYSYFQNIRLVASQFNKFLVAFYGNKILQHISSIKDKEILYLDNIYYFFKDKINSVGFNAEELYFLSKSFLIKYLGLNVNFTNFDFNIDFDISINPKLSDLKILKTFNSFNYKISKTYKFNGMNIKLNLYSENNIFDESLWNNLESGKLQNFLFILVDKFFKLNSFLNSINTKIQKLNKHPETIKHMKNLSSLLKKLDSSEYSEKLKNTLPIGDNDFYLLLAYLHDIGKADNVDLLDLYTFSNMRVDPYYSFLLLLERIIGDVNLDIKKISGERNSLNILDIYNSLSGNQEFKNITKSFFEFKRKMLFSSRIKDYDKILIEYGLNVYPIIEEKIKKLGLAYNIIDKNNYAIFNNKFNEIFKELDIDIDLEKFDVDIYLLSILLLLLEVSNIQVKELTYPHITYGLQFFQLHPEYNYLSFVLYHHNNYPSKEEILYYDGDKGLNKYKKLLNLDNKYLENISNNEAIKAKDKDYLMVLLTACDLIDALLFGRKYQRSIDISEFKVIKLLSNDFIQELKNIFHIEDNSNLEYLFEKAITILDKEFAENENYTTDIRLRILSKKNEILSMYKKI